MTVKIILLALVAAPTLHAVEHRANPIRKVVNMLQAMQKKVSDEGNKEKELYDRFMCYCKNSGGDLQKSIADAENKSPQVQAAIKAAEGQKAQLTEDLKQHKADREAANAAMKEATAIREKEAAAFAQEKADSETNIAAISKAVAALEKGMGAGFLQTNAAQLLKKAVLAKVDMLDVDRQEILSFLSNTGSYAPRSGEITGILKQMGDTFAAELADATATEEAAIKTFDELMAAKTKEVAALTQAIEAKTQRVGELGVEIVQMSDDLGDTLRALEEDKKFLAQLEKGCSTKTAEWEERQKTRADELVALAETIKVLNDDDALELFKKTLPNPSASFMQVSVSAASMQTRASTVLKQMRKAGHRTQVDFILLALSGKAANFDKVIKMIDDMVALLKDEQGDDDSKKAYCADQFDKSDDQRKALDRKVSDEESAIANAEEGIATLKDEIAALEAGIVALDKAVAEATATRKAEHSEYQELVASDSAAKELLGFAKNRLNKFYNPKLYKPPAKRELSAEDSIVVNMGGTLAPTAAPGGIAGTGISFAQIEAHNQDEVAPPPPPETFGAYTKKSEENTGVIAMIDLLIADLDKELQEAGVEEKNAQEEYEDMMRDSAEKRTLDSKTLTAKEAARADTEAALEGHRGEKAAATSELMATHEWIASLHAECDWLVSNFDARKEARSGEVDSLKKAKAVLSGADYSLLQTSRGNLRRSSA